MDEKRQEELALLYARVDDLEGRARRGEVAISPFLSPADARAAAEHARRMGASAVAFGGYGGAERVRLYLLPDYLGEVSAEALEETYGDCEISFYEGGQEIYDYYLALE